MTFEGLLEMFEGDSADTCAGKFPLMSIGGRAEGLACAEPGARTPIDASRKFYFIFICCLKYHIITNTDRDTIYHLFSELSLGLSAFLSIILMSFLNICSHGGLWLGLVHTTEISFERFWKSNRSP